MISHLSSLKGKENFGAFISNQNQGVETGDAVGYACQRQQNNVNQCHIMALI